MGEGADLVDLAVARLGALGAVGGDEQVAEGGAAVLGDGDEAPRAELAVVGDAGGGAQDRSSCPGVGPGATMSRGFPERRVRRSDSGVERSLNMASEIGGPRAGGATGPLPPAARPATVGANGRRPSGRKGAAWPP